VYIYIGDTSRRGDTGWTVYSTPIGGEAGGRMDRGRRRWQRSASRHRRSDGRRVADCVGNSRCRGVAWSDGCTVAYSVGGGRPDYDQLEK